MNFRREIEGLRGVAVLSVILFHAGFERFSGGFVGVDVFFVISGYLITTNILTEFEQGQFSIANFYERRARRILPALIFVILLCIPIAWYTLIPSDMKRFSLSIVAVSVFASNFLFWKEIGYFNAASELKPLIHTWSIALETQFYILFPLFLILLWKSGKLTIQFTLGIILLTSLALAQWASLSKPGAAFYLLPTRGWELLTGSFAAFYLSNGRRKDFNKSISESIGWLGLVLICYTVVTYNKLTPIPGIYTVVPTMGTLLIILFAKENNKIGKFLGNKVFVFTGMISYSAYLLHQPLFAFIRYKDLNNLSLFTSVFLSIITLILAYLSWRYIEEPFRKKIKRKYFYFLAACFTFIFITIGLLGVASKGFDFRFNEEQKNLLSYNFYNYKEIYKQGDCLLDPSQSYSDFKKMCNKKNNENTILIWGDSHAAALAFGLRNDFQNVSQYTSSGCPPLLGTQVSLRAICQDINKFISQEVENIKPNIIILHSNWLLYEDSNIPITLSNTVDLIKNKSPNTEVYIIGSVPQYEPSLPTYIHKNSYILEENLQLLAPTNDKISNVDSQLKLLTSQIGVHYFSPIDAFCINKQCLVTFKYEEIIMPMAWDYGHLTSAGSVYLSNKFKLFFLQKNESNVKF